MANQQSVARARQQLDDALAALSEVAGDVLVSEAAGEGALVIAAETTATGQADIRPDLLRTFTRLVVGTTLLGIDELSRRASGWEQQAAQAGAAARALAPAQDGAAPAEAPAPAPAGQAIIAAESRQQEAPAATLVDADRELSLAMIGWIFATQERVRLERYPGRMIQAAGAQIATTAAVLIGEALGWGSGDQKARSEAAYESLLQVWIDRGRTEARHSRELARAALNDITQDVIGALAEEPAIQNLIQSQSTTLAGEVLGEVRERTVSADIYVDSLSRRFFRRIRRNPPLDARERAVGEISVAVDASGTRP